MEPYPLLDGVVHCEGVRLAEIADAVGTPVFVYSTAAMQGQARALRRALDGLADPLIAYAVKANPNGAVLATLAAEGLGADVVSGGEYQRARAAGIAPERIVFSGVGKTAEEMVLALREGLCQFNLESVQEAELLSRLRSRWGRRRRLRFASIPMWMPAATPRSRRAPPTTSSASRSPTRLPPAPAFANCPG
jgi:diaminopimelate decarboxylase